VTRSLHLTSLLALGIVVPLAAQRPSPARLDSLLQHLVGRWVMSGAVRAKPATYTLDVARVLQGRFVDLRMTDVQQPPLYEAEVFIGVDSAGGTYVAHWLDNTGAAYSIPPATGEARGDTIVLNFAYADGPFRDTFSYDPRGDTWHFRLEAGTAAGQWRLFADYTVRRR